jgi:hypothetical protein
VFENLLSYFDVAIYRIFTQPSLKLIMIGIIGGGVLPMISVIICIGVIGGILIKDSKYSGFIASFIYCLIWNLIFGVRFWSTTAYSIPGLLFNLSTPFVGGYIYAGFNKSKRITSDSSETIGNDKLINKEA